MTGIEPAYSAWEADVLPLNYIRSSIRAYTPPRPRRQDPPSLTSRGQLTTIVVMEERLPDPEFFREGGFRLASRLFVRDDIRGTEEQVARFRQFAQAADPVADA